MFAVAIFYLILVLGPTTPFATLAAFARDVDRTLRLAAEDWLLIPVTDLHVRTDPQGVVDLIARVLARREVRKENRVSHGELCGPSTTTRGWRAPPGPR